LKGRCGSGTNSWLRTLFFFFNIEVLLCFKTKRLRRYVLGDVWGLDFFSVWIRISNSQLSHSGIRDFKRRE
jgi:hypothetical protein